MDLKLFVSSTTVDLAEQRAKVVERLNKMAVRVIDMQALTSEPDPPADVCARQVAACDILIVIVAYRRGTVVPEDPEGRSITQIEVDTAIGAGKPVLPFLLRDTAANRDAWPRQWNELKTDTKLVEWRERLGLRFTPVLFDADEIPDVLPAVHARMVKMIDYARASAVARADRRSRWAMGILAAAASLLVAASLMWAFVEPIQARALSWMHSYHDPVIFNGSRIDPYKTTRLLENRADIQDNSNFANDIATSTTSFDLYANTFGSFRECEKVFDEAATRGVKLRFVLTDFRDPPGDDPNWVRFRQAVEDGPLNEMETIAKGMNTINAIKNLQARHPPDRVQYRLNRRPILYTLWIRDAEEATGMAHLGVHYYGTVSQSKWPAFRVSQLTGGSQLSSMAEQFDYIWESAELPE